MKFYHWDGKEKAIFERVSRWIRIDYNMDGEPYFRFKDRRYKLSKFLRVDGVCGCAYTRPITNEKNESVLLAGYEMDTYYKPYFVELNTSCDKVRVYRYEGIQETA